MKKITWLSLPAIITAFLTILFSFMAGGAGAQIITTVAGVGSPGYTGDGGSALLAEMNFPMKVIFDTTGNMYIVDNTNNAVRMVTPDGIISTIAGTGTPGNLGDGGPAASAQLNSPSGMCMDHSGNIYISEFVNNTVRKINAAGIITTIAGNGTATFSGDGVAATATALNNPWDVAADAAGNVYIADQNNYRIRKVNTSGIISTFAGTGVYGNSGDGFAATAAKISFPANMVFDAAGNLFFCDNGNSTVRKITPGGIITTVAGSGSAGLSGDGGPATSAQFFYPVGIDVNAVGDLFIGDRDNDRVRKITAATGIISNVAGSGSFAGESGDGGPATDATLDYPGGVKLDCGGNLFIADIDGNVVRRVQFDHTPVFTGGAVQSVILCKDSVLSLNTLLAVADTDNGQGEKWSVVTPPTNGTAVATWATTSTGGTLTPTGLHYTPVTGFTGADSVRVQVRDCGNLYDTTVIYITIHDCHVGVPMAPAVAAGQLLVYPNPNDGSFTLLLNTAVKEQARCTVTDMLGQTVKTLAIPTNTPVAIIADYPAGVYYIRVTAGGQQWTEKVMLEK